MVGRKRCEEDEYASTVSFLASDSEEWEDTSKSRWSLDVKVNSTKVFVWGLNDKDQLGGQKGSKIKLPVFSDTLSNLKPIHIAGGSKSLFIVTQEGKVYACGEGTQCENFVIFLSLRFYVKSILEILEVQNLPF